MSVPVMRTVRLLALVTLVAFAMCATAGSNLPDGYPDPACGERPEIPERPEQFETEEVVQEYNAKVDAYHASMERLIECVREYVANANEDMKQIRKRAEEAIDTLNQ